MRVDLQRALSVSLAQRDVLLFRAPPAPDGTPQVEEVGILGEYGGGKTFIAAHRYFDVCASNSGIGTKHDPLMCGISAPTSTGLTNGPLAALDKVIPRQAVRWDKRTSTKDPHIMLRNWVKIILYTGRGALDGPNLFQFWADEIQDKSYEGQWANMSGRVRDNRAHRLNAQASGIAQEGYVAQIFRNPAQDGCHCTKLLFPEDNEENLVYGYTDRLRSASAGGRRRDPDGWMIPDGLFYPAFSRERNIDPVTEPRESLHHIPTDVAVDLGARAAVTFWQPRTVRCSYGRLGMKTEVGQLCVDEWMPDDMDAEEIAKSIDEIFPWTIAPSVSTIALDPTAEYDQVRWFQKYFPSVRIVMSTKNSYYWHNVNGERAVERAVLDANGSVRMFVHPDLMLDRTGRGVIHSMQGYLRSKPKDKKFEHAADSVRYQIQHRLPLPVVRTEEPKEPSRETIRRARPIAPRRGVVNY